MGKRAINDPRWVAAVRAAEQHAKQAQRATSGKYKHAHDYAMARAWGTKSVPWSVDYGFKVQEFISQWNAREAAQQKEIEAQKAKQQELIRLQQIEKERQIELQKALEAEEKRQIEEANKAAKRRRDTAVWQNVTQGRRPRLRPVRRGGSPAPANFKPQPRPAKKPQNWSRFKTW